ncbi:hypothetical protein [Rubrolithibacter danxiaensis]|uniref:hypothetical protein n=1 Tax=Rubrolithibacter danxiaensis TaxID=3390805 RepID=UPI003BF89681
MTSSLKYFILFFLTTSILSGCATKRHRTPAEKVSMVINVKSNDPDLVSTNLDYYSLKMLDALERFQKVDLGLAEEDEPADVTLSIDIQNLTIWPKNEYRTRRTFSRSVIIGKDAGGNPIYGIVRASADIIREQIRTDASLSVNLKFSGKEDKSFQRVFVPRYNWNRIYAENIQGDPRALDPSILMASVPPPDPQPIEILIQLSEQEMFDRVSREIRSFYNK